MTPLTIVVFKRLFCYFLDNLAPSFSHSLFRFYLFIDILKTSDHAERLVDLINSFLCGIRIVQVSEIEIVYQLLL